MNIGLVKSKFTIKTMLALLLFLSLVSGPVIYNNISLAEEATQEAQKPDLKKLKQDLINSGKLYYYNRKYEAAINEWEKALLLDPGNKRIQKYLDSAKIRLEKQQRRDVKLISITAPPEEMSKILTLDDCINIAIENNIPLRVAKKNITLAEMRIWESRRNLFPKVSMVWEEYHGKIQERRYIGKKEYIEGSQTVPFLQGAEAYYILKQAEINLKVAKEEYKKTRNELVLQVKKGFYALAKARENLKIQKELKQEVDKIFDMVKKQSEAGIASKLELLNVSSQEGQAKYQMVSAQGDEAMSELMLKNTMNVDYRETLEIDSKLIEFQRTDVEFGRVLNAAFLNRPEIKINSWTVDYNKYEKDITKARGWPKVDIMGNWGLAKEEYESIDNMPTPRSDGTIDTPDPNRKLEQQWYAGFKVSMPFWGSTGEYSLTREQWVPVINAYSGTEAFTQTAKVNILDKLQYFSDKLSAEMDYDRARQEFEKIKQDVTAEVRESCFGYEKALILFDTASNKVKYQEGDLELMRLKRGMDEIQDSNVVESMIKLAQEKFGYVQALADCYIAAASINKAVGLDDYIKVEEKVQPK